MGILVIGLLTILGCANGEIRLGDPFDRELTLDEAQHRYTVLVRWSKFQEAKAFVAAQDRQAFLKRMEAFEDVRFTDSESDPVELDAEKMTATVRVEYTFYTPSSPFEIELGETQVWTRNGVTNDWEVLSTFDPLDGMASN
jgi:hypothetical protein